MANRPVSPGSFFGKSSLDSEPVFSLKAGRFPFDSPRLFVSLAFGFGSGFAGSINGAGCHWRTRTTFPSISYSLSESLADEAIGELLPFAPGRAEATCPAGAKARAGFRVVGKGVSFATSMTPRLFAEANPCTSQIRPLPLPE